MFLLLKRDFKLFGRGLTMALCITAALAVICACTALSVVYGNEQLFVPVKLALVDSSDSNLSRLAVSYIKGQPSIDALLDIESVDYDSAIDGFENGSYSAILLLPENYMSSITSGRECEAKIILSDALANHYDTVYAVAKLGQHLLSAGQNGVFAGEHIIWQYGLGNEIRSQYLTLSNLSLITEAAGSYNNYFDVEQLSYGNSSLNSTTYYICAYLTFFIAVIGVFFAELYKKDMVSSLIRRLRSCKLSTGGYLAGKIVFPLAFRTVIFFVCIPVIALAAPVDIGAISVIFALFGIIMITVFTSCFMVGFFRYNASAAVLALMSVGLFLCGGVVSRENLPTIVTSLGDLSPFGAFMSCFKPIFGGEVSALSLILCTLYTVIALLLCIKRLSDITKKENG